MQNKTRKEYLEGRNKESSQSLLIDGSTQFHVDNVDNGLEQRKVPIMIE